MNKSFIFAIVIMGSFLGLTYFEYLPFYVSVTVVLCTFIIAMTHSIISAIKNLQSSQDVTEAKTIATLQESLGFVVNKLEMILNTATELRSENNDCYCRIQQTLEHSNVVMENIFNKTSELNENLKTCYSNMTSTLGEEFVQLNGSLRDNSVALSKLNGTVQTANKDTIDAVSRFEKVTLSSTTVLGESVKSVTDDLTLQINAMIVKLETLGNCIDSYIHSAKLIEESNSSLSVSVSKSVEMLNNTISNITRLNSRAIDDLKDTMAETIEDLLKGLKNVTTDQTESIADGEEKIRQSVDKLCVELSLNLKKLEIDVDGICESVEEIRKMSQIVEQSDKKLLVQVNKICK